MRINGQQAQAISDNVHRYLGEHARIWLFGSRLDAKKRGGDVDIYVEAAPHALMDELRCKIQLEEALDLPVDLIVRPNGDDAPIAASQKRGGHAMSEHTRLIDKKLAQNTEPYTAVLFYMEKLGVIDGVMRWKELRELRNAINHEYEENAERLSQFFLELSQATPDLFNWHQRLNNFCHETYGLEIQKS
jgi:predicted nucleotidyltransferase